MPLCERADGIVRQTAGIVASPSDLTFDLWTDGACAGNPGGPGGYAAVLVARRADGSIAKQWETSGGEPAATNNRMELMAVVAGLREVPAPARVRIHIDSSYVMYTFTQCRRERWQGNGWGTSARKPVKNRELWEQLFTEVDRHQVEWAKVAGHTGGGVERACGPTRVRSAGRARPALSDSADEAAPPRLRLQTGSPLGG